MSDTRLAMPVTPPGMPLGKRHSVRVTEELWESAKAAAAANRVYLAGVITKVLEDYANPKRTPKPVPRRPREEQPVTIRVIRIRDDVWMAARARADERGEFLSDVITTGLAAYVAKHGE